MAKKSRAGSFADRVERAAPKITDDGLEVDRDDGRDHTRRRPVIQRPRPVPIGNKSIDDYADEVPETDATDEPDETDWVADLPDHDPADVRSALGDQTLSAVGPTEADLDRLWDWVRADKDHGYAFLGEAPSTSAHMRERLERFDGHFYSLIEETTAGPDHVGFAGLFPVMEQSAFLHLFLRADVRGRAPELIPQLLDMAAEQYPGRNFLVETKLPAMARMLAPLGFTVGYLMTWKPPTVKITPPAEAVEESDGTDGS